MGTMVQNAVDRANAEVEKLQRDRDAAELINLRAEVKRLKEAICDSTEAKDE